MSEGVHVVVAGLAGGVGTTTVAALLFDALRTRPLGAPRLQDHAGGVLGDRLPHGDEAATIDERVTLTDAGRHAARLGAGVLGRPHDLLVVVAARTPSGLADARELLEELRTAAGTGGTRRTLLVAQAVFGPARDAAEIEALRASFERSNVAAVPRDPALATGGRIVLPRLAPATRTAVHRVTAQVADLVARHRGADESEPVSARSR